MSPLIRLGAKGLGAPMPAPNSPKDRSFTGNIAYGIYLAPGWSPKEPYTFAEVHMCQFNMREPPPDDHLFLE